MKRLVAAGLFVTFFATAALADIAKRDEPKQKSVDSTLMIRIDKDAKEARLVVPRNQLRALRAELEQLDGGQLEPIPAFTVSKLQTVVAGGLMSLAFVFGGVWYVRKGSGGIAGRALGIGAVMLAGGALTTLVFANYGPPAEARSITGKLFSQYVHQYKFATGKIKLETADDGENVVLIVPDTTTPAKPGDE